MKRDEDMIQFIEYEKYLSCPKCKEIELYCPEHRVEVEELLSRFKVI